MTLRALRAERGWSLSDLARRAYVARGYISELENAQKRPSIKTAAALDRALEAGGALAALVTPPPTVAPDQQDRVIHAVTHPMRLDPATVTALADVLAAQRRLDDTVDAHLLIPATDAQWSTVMQLARDARGPAAADLHAVAAEWTQFLAWLHAEARRDAPAVRLLVEAAEQADAIDNGPLAAQAENFRGYVERQRGNARGIVRHFEAAYRTPGATALQRAGDAAQAAHGYALLGEPRTAARLLGEANDLVTRAEDDPPLSAAYWLSPTFTRINLGLAYLALGDLAEAAQQLQAGLDGIPEDQRASEWAAEYRRALESAVR